MSEQDQQLDQAVQIVAQACAWARLPSSDTVSPLQQMQQIQQALGILINAARPPQPTVVHPLPESNGTEPELVTTDG